MDGATSKQGRRLASELENLGLILLNGRSESDPEGNFTFLNKNGSSIIDLIWINFGGLFTLSDFSILNAGRGGWGIGGHLSGIA